MHNTNLLEHKQKFCCHMFKYVIFFYQEGKCYLYQVGYMIIEFCCKQDHTKSNDCMDFDIFFFFTVAGSWSDMELI